LLAAVIFSSNASFLYLKELDYLIAFDPSQILYLKFCQQTPYPMRFAVAKVTQHLCP
jgi:hypothetical protein